MNLTRQEVTTFLRQPVNLGCYATTTSAGSILEYYWTKDNQTVTQSPNVQAFDGVLVVTPEKDSDFGTYECNVTNGMSSGLCRISLVQVTSTPGKHSNNLNLYKNKRAWSDWEEETEKYGALLGNSVFAL